MLIVLWILATAGSNALLRDSAVYARWHVVLPAIAVVVAVALRYLLQVSRLRQSDANDGGPKPTFRRLAAGLLAGVLAVMMTGQLVYYFGWHVPLLEKQVRLSKPYPDIYDMAMRSLDLPSATDIYQIGDPIPDINVPRTWINFFTKSDPSTLRFYPLATQEITPEFVAELPTDRNLALFVDPQATDATALLQQHFDCALQHSPYPIDPPEKEFLLCFVPMDTGG
jgi:hypothetical protein